MTTLRTRSRIPLTLALAGALLVGVPALAGCGLISNAVHGATGQDLPSAPDTGDSGGGDADTPFDSLPATFPSDIPLIDGEVVQGIDVGTGWSVLIACDDPVESFNTAADALEGAGYEAIARSTDEGQGFGNFRNDTYSINLSASDSADYGNVVAYTVVKL